MAFTRLIDEKRSFSPGNYQVKSKEKNAWNKYCIYKSWSNFAWLLSKKQGRKIIEISTVIFIFWSNFEWFMIKYYSFKSIFILNWKPAKSCCLNYDFEKIRKNVYSWKFISHWNFWIFGNLSIRIFPNLLFAKISLAKVSPNKVSVYKYVLESNSDNLNPHVTIKLVCQVGW